MLSTHLHLLQTSTLLIHSSAEENQRPLEAGTKDLNTTAAACQTPTARGELGSTNPQQGCCAQQQGQHWPVATSTGAMWNLHSATADLNSLLLMLRKQPKHWPQRALLCLQSNQHLGQDMKGLVWHLWKEHLHPKAKPPLPRAGHKAHQLMC